MDDPFDGKGFIPTSKTTFSSANWFAGWIQDNGLGRVLGEPTGNAPTSYGDVLSFTLPNSGLSYGVSYEKWIRVDPARDPADCITADVVTHRDTPSGKPRS